MDQSELRGMIRTQSAKMAEMSLSSKSAKELHCFKRTLCIVGATMEGRLQNGRSALSPTTLAKGVDQFRQILELMVQDIAQNRQEREEDYPNIHQVLGRYHSTSKYLFVLLKAKRRLPYPFKNGARENLVQRN